MKKTTLNAHYSLLIFCLFGLFSTPGCNFSVTDKDKQQPETSVVAKDTTFVSAPDSVNPEWNAKLDSMLRISSTAKQDTNLAKLYADIGDMFAENDFEKAKEYYTRLKNLSEQLNWNEGRYLFASNYAQILNRQGLMDSALTINKQALELAKSENNEKRIALMNINTGNSYFMMDWDETALQYYMEALPFLEKTNDEKRLGILYCMMGRAYDNMNVTDKAVYYGEKAVALREDYPLTLLALGQAYTSANQYEKANDYYEKAIQTSKKQNNRYILAEAYNLLGANALTAFNLDKAEMYGNIALEISNKIGSEETYFGALVTLGKMEELRGNFSKSEEYVKKALPLTVKLENKQGQRVCYIILSELSVPKQNYRDNMRFWEKADSMETAMAFETGQRSAKEMEAKYETEKKEFRITDLEKEKRLMIGLSIAGGALLLLALATFILLWRWMVQKKRVAEKQQQLAEQQIKQMEQEKQLVATQAVLDGETRERARIARDLHDGLGSMLTGVKLNLLEMKKGATVEYADVERFDKAMGLLDESVKEMRRVAHHLMPDSLSRFGLKTALSDFCCNYPNITFNYYGDESRLDPKLEVMIYRSIHELVNNALKYAGASRILVQIMQEPDRIAFTVQDDGCGFDVTKETKGTGLRNIRNRIASFGGDIQIDSKAGEGTEINGELRIRN